MTLRIRLLMLRSCTIVALLTACSVAGAQAIIDGEDEEVAAGDFTIDLATTPAAYAGRYHFGFSEGESDLVLTVRKGKVTGALSYGVWDTKANNWKSKTLRFTGTIDGNMLIAGSWKGLFVRRGDRRGLLLIASPYRDVAMNFGYRYEE